MCMFCEVLISSKTWSQHEKKIAVYLFPPSDCYVEKDISKTKETSREYPEEQTEMNISMFEHINLLY